MNNAQHTPSHLIPLAKIKSDFRLSIAEDDPWDVIAKAKGR